MLNDYISTMLDKFGDEDGVRPEVDFSPAAFQIYKDGVLECQMDDDYIFDRYRNLNV